MEYFWAVCPVCYANMGGWITEQKAIKVIERHQQGDFYQKCKK